MSPSSSFLEVVVVEVVGRSVIFGRVGGSAVPFFSSRSGLPFCGKKEKEVYITKIVL